MVPGGPWWSLVTGGELEPGRLVAGAVGHRQGGNAGALRGGVAGKTEGDLEPLGTAGDLLAW